MYGIIISVCILSRLVNAGTSTLVTTFKAVGVVRMVYRCILQRYYYKYYLYSAKCIEKVKAVVHTAGIVDLDVYSFHVRGL